MIWFSRLQKPTYPIDRQSESQSYFRLSRSNGFIDVLDLIGFWI